MNYRNLLLISSVCCGTALTVFAEEDAPKDDAPLDISSLNLDETPYALPVPGEILASLKATNPDVWKSVTAAAGELKAEAEDEASAAALLGAAVADCFLAIETKDAELFETRSKQVLGAAEKLGAEQPLLDAGGELSGMAKAGEWEKMLPKLDRLHLDTLDAMRKIGDEDAEAICLASGWLRGLHLFTEGLLADYSAEGTLALRQSDLVKHLSSQLGKISDSAKENESVKKLSAALEKLPAALPQGREDTLTKEQVAALNEIAKSAH